MNERLRQFLAAGAFACAPYLASAAGFTGAFQPSMYSDSKISDGVQLIGGQGLVQVSGGPGPSDLNLSLSFNSLSISLPLVVVDNMATLASDTYTVGNTTVLDTYLFSDGNNMALAYVAQDQPSQAISFVVSAWQQSPSFADANSAVGQWMFASVVGDNNLRNLGDGFEAKQYGGFNVVDTGSGYAIDVPQANLHVPLTIAQGNISLASAPARAGSGYWQVLGWTYGNGLGALFFVGNGPNDIADVSITLGLVTQVPEPETWATLLAGLGLLGGVAARRRRPR